MFYGLLILFGFLIIIANLILLIKEKNKFVYFGNYKYNRFLINLKRTLKLQLTKSSNFTKKETFLILLIGALFTSITTDLYSIPKFFFIGFILGFIMIKLIRNIQEKADKTKKLKEVATLFEAVELYTKAGYTVYQALKAARLLTESIRPALDKCLEYWGSNPQRALEKLQEELKLQESEVLILLLAHMESVGAKEMEGMIKRETNNIQRIGKMKKQITISNRPLILMVYRILPLISILGITVGSLLYRTYSVFTQSGILQ